MPIWSNKQNGPYLKRLDRARLTGYAHLQGRIHFDLKHLDEAASCFTEEMEFAQGILRAPGFIRAVHELSRIQGSE